MEFTVLMAIFTMIPFTLFFIVLADLQLDTKATKKTTIKRIIYLIALAGLAITSWITGLTIISS